MACHSYYGKQKHTEVTILGLTVWDKSKLLLVMSASHIGALVQDPVAQLSANAFEIVGDGPSSWALLPMQESWMEFILLAIALP